MDEPGQMADAAVFSGQRAPPGGRSPLKPSPHSSSVAMTRFLRALLATPLLGFSALGPSRRRPRLRPPLRACRPSPRRPPGWSSATDSFRSTGTNAPASSSSKSRRWSRSSSTSRRCRGAWGRTTSASIATSSVSERLVAFHAQRAARAADREEHELPRCDG